MITRILGTYVPSCWVYARADRENTVFLDSSMRNELGRRSYIGLIPHRILTDADGDLGTILDGIGDSVLMGYVTYDHCIGMKGLVSVHPETGLPGFCLADFDIVVEDDPENGVLKVVCRGRVMDENEELALVEELVSDAVEPTVPEGVGYRIISDTPSDRFVSAVESARSMMEEGEFYVVNITRTIRAGSATDPFDAFLRLRSISPSPYGAYIDLLGTQVVSSSMELLLDLEGGRARTRPIKGTAPRYGDPVKDGESLGKLLSSDKDRSELLMVTDMERNDMNRFCVPGTVEVDSFFRPEEYATVFHTVSDVEGTVAEGTGLGRIAECMLPGGSVTGAPKRACIGAIDSLEECRRGLYTGSICLFSEERTEMNIAIRTMVHSGNVYSIGIGGGITYESDPDSEYMETEQKAKATLRSLGDRHGA